MLGPLKKGGIDGRDVTLRTFASVLSNQLLLLSQIEHLSPIMFMITPTEPMELPLSKSSPQKRKPAEVVDLCNSNSDTSEISSGSDNTELTTLMAEGRFERRFQIVDRIGEQHTLCLTPLNTSSRGKKYRNRKKCNWCGNNTCAFCLECGLVLCYPIRLAANNSVNQREEIRRECCWMRHVRAATKTSKRLRNSPQNSLTKWFDTEAV